MIIFNEIIFLIKNFVKKLIFFVYRNIILCWIILSVSVNVVFLYKFKEYSYIKNLKCVIW